MSERANECMHNDAMDNDAMCTLCDEASEMRRQRMNIEPVDWSNGRAFKLASSTEFRNAIATCSIAFVRSLALYHQVAR